MNNKFTPGPWMVKTTKHGPTYIGPVEECESVPKSCHDWHVQVFESGITPHVHTWEASQERLRANAHLIAAAPDLYAACSSFIDAWRCDDDEEREEAIKAMFAAMSKAQGAAS